MLLFGVRLSVIVRVRVLFGVEAIGSVGITDLVTSCTEGET